MRILRQSGAGLVRQLGLALLLSAYTTLHVGGVVDYFVRVQTKGELKEAWRAATQAKLRPFILGGGSNVLVKDGLLERFVIKVELSGISYQEGEEGLVFVTAAAGVSWDELVAATVEKGLSGLENLSGIPGTVGAAPVQNINAYGATVSEVIKTVEVFDGKYDHFQTLQNEECHFGYRDSIFKQTEHQSKVITAVTFTLKKTSALNVTYRSSSQSLERYLKEHTIVTPTTADMRQAVLMVRSNIGMLAGQFRSAGSFFKNTVVSREVFNTIESIVERDFAEASKQMSPWHWPMPSGEEKIATAFLLECSPYNKNTYGIQRFRGVVGLSPLHSLSVVTEEGATADDVTAFVDEVKNAVRDIFAVDLYTEVDYIY